MTASPTDAFADLVSGRAVGPGPAEEFRGPMLPRGSLSEEVANRILSLIRSGNLKSGDRLPTEAEMTIALQISRPPLREALKALTLMGVLESRQGGRYTITDLSPSRLVTPFNIMLSGKEYDAARHYEARAAVDLELVRLSCARASEEQRAHILRLARDGMTFCDDPVGFRVLDFEFHQTINEGAGNVFLMTVAQGLYNVALDLRRRATETPGVIARSCQDHVLVAEALMARDTERAVAAYRAHLDHVRDTTIQSQRAGKDPAPNADAAGRIPPAAGA